ncbi:efflux RND transporter periplasmic adaptor subunit [Temperatibacter marinus]|uniref:Efflux RND transporter periplasmic adaptor subunit n=1 Tax=Temperatibacter marinus TaxID=1456591 RepID=A0AA52EA76_9PROT|nr:efflux RND transporter periplasmic adaptor subunit [Temperatibacter marinus]WND01562.1 efflux RND transporter periplasmic adaptor subunit [Temperatibacter marinus]
MRQTIQKTISIAFIAIFTSATTFIVMAKSTSSSQEGQQRRPVPVEVMTIQLQDSYEEWRSFTGRALAGKTSPLGFEMNGTLNKVTVDIGSRVSKGLPLAFLDTARAEANLNSLQAQKNAAEARLKLANQTLSRTKKTFTQGHLSAQRMDEAAANQLQALADLNNLSASIEALKIDIEKMTIKAPFSGVITERMADEGRIIGAGTPVLTLVETGHLEGHIGVSSGIADALEKKAEYRLLNPQRRDITGHSIRNILPVIEGQTRTRMVIFTLPEGAIRDGDLVTMLIKDKKIATGAWVPLRALSADVRGLWRLNKVKTAEDGSSHVAFENVQILYTTGRKAFVSGTLSEGDKIVAGGIDKLAHNERVKIVKSRTSVLPESEVASQQSKKH